MKRTSSPWIIAATTMSLAGNAWAQSPVSGADPSKTAGNPVAAVEANPTQAAPAVRPAGPVKLADPVVKKSVDAPKLGGPLQIKVGDVSVRFGLLLQPQVDVIQDANANGYAQSLFLRRVRFLVGGQVANNVFFFAETENSSLGKMGTAGKVMGTGFQMLDATAEWRAHKKFNLQAGLVRVPSSREALKSSSSEFPIDFSAYAFTSSANLAVTGGNRDTGFLARGYFLKDKLEYRVATFAGMRGATSRNPFRTVARLQYNVFDAETYTLPSYAGAYFGNKKILAFGASFDKEKDYRGIIADAFLDVPVPIGSVMSTVTYQNLDGGTTFATQLPAQDIFTAEAGLFVRKARLGPWARYEQRRFDADPRKNEMRYQVGLNYYVHASYFNIKAAFGQLRPETGKNINQFTLQLQAFYF